MAFNHVIGSARALLVWWSFAKNDTEALAVVINQQLTTFILR